MLHGFICCVEKTKVFFFIYVTVNTSIRKASMITLHLKKHVAKAFIELAVLKYFYYCTWPNINAVLSWWVSTIRDNSPIRNNLICFH